MKSLFFACQYKFIEIKSLLETTGMDEIKNGCDHSGYKTLKLAAISQERINRLNLFFTY